MSCGRSIFAASPCGSWWMLAPVRSAMPIASLPVPDFTARMCPAPMPRPITAASQHQLIPRPTMSSPRTDGHLIGARPTCPAIGIFPDLISCRCRARGLPALPPPLGAKRNWLFARMWRRARRQPRHLSHRIGLRRAPRFQSTIEPKKAPRKTGAPATRSQRC